MTKPTQKKRRSRFARESKALPVSSITTKERDILLMVHKHRFLDVELLHHLLVSGSVDSEFGDAGRDGKRRPKTYGFGKEALYKSLRKLFHAGYMNRHFLYDRPIGRGLGSPPTVYGLGTKSAPLLSEVLGCTHRDIQKIVEANKVKSPFLRHALGVARIRVMLESACADSNGRVSLLFWEQGQQLHDTVIGIDEGGDEKRLTVYPDAMFALEVEGKRACYMLEYDRGSMVIDSKGKRGDIVSKLRGYWHYSDQKLHTRRFAYRKLPDGSVNGLIVSDDNHPIDEHIGDFAEPIRGFTVLFVIPGADVQNAPLTGRIANILSAVNTMGRPFSSKHMFWFTTAESFGIASKSVFDHIWIPANPTLGKQSLIK